LLRKTDSNNPGDWLYLAESDLEGIRELATRKLAYHLCRSKLAEVLEKVFKAELIRNGWTLQKTHDLMRLLEEIEKYTPELLTKSEPLGLALAESYFSERYPGFDLEEPDWPDLRGKVQAVEELLATVKAKLAIPG
jgi:HEPN domain-containing protein